MKMKTLALLLFLVPLAACDDDGSSAGGACDHLQECVSGCGGGQVTCAGYDSAECHSCITSTSCQDHCSFFSNPIGTTWACAAKCGDGGGGGGGGSDATAGGGGSDAPTGGGAGGGGTPTGGEACDSCVTKCTTGGLPEAQCKDLCAAACK